MLKKLPIGIDLFEKFRVNDFYYVDKTMFIAELIHNWGEVNLFTRPRRFGKTLNMSMLKSFFEIGGNTEIFDGLAISREKEICEKHMGKYPVVFISLKGVDALNFESALAAMREVIVSEAARFQFLRNSTKLSLEEKEAYQRLINVDISSESGYTLTDGELKAGLKTLSRLLEKHYDSKVIILIDEYDVPLDKAFNAGYYDEMVSLIRNILGNALKTNESLAFAVLTGCLRISKESIFTGLNNLMIHTISNSAYDEYFGFTDAEVDDLLVYYGLSSYKETFREWYDGYIFGKTSVYCPWDVLNYAYTLRSDPKAPPENYWANTSGNDLIRRMLNNMEADTKDDIEELMNGGTVVKSIRQELTYRDIDDSPENVWSVLYSTGYLTGRRVENADADVFELWLPNGEIRRLFAHLIKDWFRNVTRSDSERINSFCEAFSAGDAGKIQDMLNDYLWDCISIRDTAVRNDLKENFYHGMLLGLLQFRGSWIVKSNTEAGIGYSDISIRTRERLGIVIEIKYAHDGNLTKACDEALEQIEEKNYAETLQRQSMKKILKYGIAFYEKECMVKSA